MLFLPSFLTAVSDTAAEVADTVSDVAAGAVEVAGDVAAETGAVAEEMVDVSTQAIASGSLSPLGIGILVIYAILCVGLVTVILSQKKRSANPGGSTAIGGTYWDKNKGRSAEGKMELITKWGIAAFMGVTFFISLNLI